MQQCCAWACAPVRFLTRNISQHIATGWPNARNTLRPTMLRSVAFKCCNHLAGACKCWANNVGICCIEMFLSFGRGFRCKTLRCFPGGNYLNVLYKLHVMSDYYCIISMQNYVVIGFQFSFLLHFNVSLNLLNLKKCNRNLFWSHK